MIEPGWPRGNRPTPRVMWQVHKDGSTMSCEINEHPLGWEVRCYLPGALYYSRVHRMPQPAVEEAEQRKSELLAEGWSWPLIHHNCRSAQRKDL